MRRGERYDIFPTYSIYTCSLNRHLPIKEKNKRNEARQKRFSFQAVEQMLNEWTTWFLARNAKLR